MISTVLSRTIVINVLAPVMSSTHLNRCGCLFVHAPSTLGALEWIPPSSIQQSQTAGSHEHPASSDSCTCTLACLTMLSWFCLVAHSNRSICAVYICSYRPNTTDKHRPRQSSPGRESHVLVFTTALRLHLGLASTDSQCVLPHTACLPTGYRVDAH